MQMSQVQDRFTHAERCIEQAAMACRSASGVPQQLRDSLTDLDREMHDAEPLIRQARSETEVRECIDRLEELGDRTMQACRNADGLDRTIGDSVKEAHRDLSELKHQLH